MKKKVLSVLLCMAMSVSMLAGCGKAGSENGGTKEASESEGGGKTKKAKAQAPQAPMRWK